MLDHMPMNLIENICTQISTGLWNLCAQKQLETAEGINIFREDLRNFIIRELYACSIVTITPGDKNDSNKI